MAYRNYKEREAGKELGESQARRFRNYYIPLRILNLVFFLFNHETLSLVMFFKWTLIEKGKFSAK